jgi:2-oxoacid:acceptor oxidoreductase delta subunit (pyruvate/2-ketoisovalerate family)
VVETTAHGVNKEKLMRSMNIFGPDPKVSIKYSELPIGATQIGFDPNLNKTGTWRFIRPVMTTTVSPCNDACPAGVDVRGFVVLTQEGLLERAIELYLNENPFPAVCGRVCFHPCETACNRGSYDEAVSINGLEHFIGERVLKSPPCLKDNGRSVAVIGSGPAGLSGAYFLRRLGYSVKVFERDPKAGGILRYGIPEYRLPKRVLDREINRLTAMGVDIQTGRNLGQNLALEELNTYDALLIATGAHAPVDLDIPGAKADGVYLGLDFLKRVAMGDIKAFDKRVAVIGGGNTAVDVARTILRLGGEPVIYYRRTTEEMPAIKSEISDCEEEGIGIHCLATPVRILSNQNKVVGIELIRNELGKPDKSSRRAPVPVKGTNFRVDVDAVILAVGEAADLSPFSDLLGTERQLLVANEYGQSTDKRIFAGGDVAHYQRTVVDAVGSGKRAAIGIDGYLKGVNEKEVINRLHSVATNRQGALSFKKYLDGDFSTVAMGGQVIHFEDLNANYFQHEKRNERRKLPVAMRIKSFKEVRRGFTLPAAQKEAARCLSCGLCNACYNCFLFCPESSVCLDEGEFKTEVDYDYCKGCGICAEECPVGAIIMEKEE